MPAKQEPRSKRAKHRARWWHTRSEADERGQQGAAKKTRNFLLKRQHERAAISTELVPPCNCHSHGTQDKQQERTGARQRRLLYVFPSSCPFLRLAICCVTFCGVCRFDASWPGAPQTTRCATSWQRARTGKPVRRHCRPFAGLFQTAAVWMAPGSCRTARRSAGPAAGSPRPLGFTAWVVLLAVLIGRGCPSRQLHYASEDDLQHPPQRLPWPAAYHTVPWLAPPEDTFRYQGVTELSELVKVRQLLEAQQPASDRSHRRC